ncbi:MAG: sugar ABC transporter ATP-binding protein [Firmicutes bacterium HGW-Firmicutes-2]|jgi:methyl-galactoside transport system ATP-binding protein|nr:MAG: sugar ABC transporter ATP-binding protein [Firmicutes bacterium HGW-Firmicutes-2]PKP50433.1 MAG: sugar ABC transporter ATP-binding protein [Bacteroidetes bacterium HGW-Bacteroidetes-1]
MVKQSILKIEGVSKSFSGVKVLDQVCLDVKEGTVHSLMGENGAGKSTLMKCLFGIYKQDEGTFHLKGENVNFTDPKHALEHGVSMVHQELNQVTKRTVSENIWLGRYPTKRGFVDENKMYQDTKSLFTKIKIDDIDPNTRLSELSVSKRQMVEIVKAVSYEAKVIILDEPTSSLTEQEVDKLFEIIETLKKQGCGIVYISHKMDEIFAISDEVTVLRDGEYIGTNPIEELDMDKVINMMVGRDLSHRFPPVTNVPGDVKMVVKNLKTRYEPMVNDVSFELKKGEILGIYGLVGARRTELVEAIFGMRTIESGEIFIDGKKLNNSSPHKTIENKLALVTEERRSTGIFEVANIRFNTCSANIKKYVNNFGLLSEKEMFSDTEKQIASMRIKTFSQESLIRELSGGNQQKVIIGRWLATDPDILLLDEPTRGIDVGAKYDIYNLMIELANNGKSIIMVSSEMPEILGVTNRIMVMSKGYVADILDTKNANQNDLLKLSAKYL